MNADDERDHAEEAAADRDQADEYGPEIAEQARAEHYAEAVHWLNVACEIYHSGHRADADPFGQLAVAIAQVHATLAQTTGPERTHP